MKRIISLLLIVLALFSLTSCNGATVLKISQEFPEGKTPIEVECEDYGDNVYLETNRNIKDISVNKMVYNEEKDSYSVEKTAYVAESFTKNDCLKIIVDLDQAVPYVMIKYTLGKNTYQKYIYRHPDGRFLLLER